MSEPVTLYCIAAHEYGSRQYAIGDVAVLAAPSTAREFIASGNWSYTPPDDVQEAPPDEPQVVPVVVKPAKSKSGKR